MLQRIQVRPSIFIDADVLIAGAASPSEHSASQLVVRLAEITLIEAFTSQQVICEVKRNLEEILPKALPIFQLMSHRCLNIVSDPKIEKINKYQGCADLNDLPLLVSALQHTCAFLITFNLRHYKPGHPEIEVLEPGTVVELGGINEITRSTQDLSENVFGVISTRPAYTMNGGAGENDTHPPVAMTGRVPVKCVGRVRKGDRLVSAGAGVARAAGPGEATAFNVIGRSLENKTTVDIGTIEAIVTIK